MSWLSRLFFRNKDADRPDRPSYAISIPEGTDPKMWERTRPPIRNRKKYTAEEIDADNERYRTENREKSRYISAFKRQRAQSVGAKTFIWQTAGDGAVCPECRKLEGKRISYQKPPKIGFPGDHECPTEEWCRCWDEPIFPK
jgi:uncharacterized protein with gpF-like domain